MTVLVEKLLAIHEWIVHLGIWNWSSELSTCRSLIVFIKKSMPQYGWKKIRIDVWNRSYKVHTYTRVQNVCPGWKTAENQVNHQNFDPILLTKKLWPFNMRMKQKKKKFFCFILKLKGQSFLVSKVGSKFWWLPCFPAVFHPGQTFCTRVYAHQCSISKDSKALKDL